jgi:putative transposase
MPGQAYRRNLPHVFPKGHAIFITWRLHGSLPVSAAMAARKAPKLTAGQRFVRIDQCLDAAKRGPLWLKDDRIAEDVCRMIEHGGEPPLNHYALHEYVVMPNHVHAFFTPRIDMAEIMQLLKGSTARFANQLLGRRGNPFWQQESYDHFCRNPAEFERIRNYIMRNPLKAGLTATLEGWPWSSVYRRRAAAAGLEMAKPGTT